MHLPHLVLSVLTLLPLLPLLRKDDNRKEMAKNRFSEFKDEGSKKKQKVQGAGKRVEGGGDGGDKKVTEFLADG